MFTGRKPTASLFENGLDLHQFSKIALPRRAMEIIEPSLLSEFGDENDHVNKNGSNEMGISNVRNCLFEILKIGFFMFYGIACRSNGH